MKYKSLESLRGIAALVVVLFHSPFVYNGKHAVIGQGNIFVDFFFILSGFVMALAYSKKIEQGLTFKKFIIPRVGRLYPLHVFMLLIWVPYILAKTYAFHTMGLGSTDPLEQNSLFTFVSNLLLINSLNINESLSWNCPAWSISVEFFTYIFFFFFAFFSKAIGSSLKYLCVCILAYTLLYKLTGSSLLSTHEFGYLRCVGGFFLGAWIFKTSKGHKLNISYIIHGALEILLVTISLYLVYLSQAGKVFQLITIISFGLTIYLFSIQSSGVLSKALSVKPMIYLGTLSYSIYMIHAIIFALAGHIYKYILKLPTFISDDGNVILNVWYADIINVVLLIIVIFISHFTFKYIESPFRDRFRKIATSNKSKHKD